MRLKFAIIERVAFGVQAQLFAQNHTHVVQHGHRAQQAACFFFNLGDLFAVMLAGGGHAHGGTAQKFGFVAGNQVVQGSGLGRSQILAAYEQLQGHGQGAVALVF